MKKYEPSSFLFVQISVSASFRSDGFAFSSCARLLRLYTRALRPYTRALRL